MEKQKELWKFEVEDIFKQETLDDVAGKTRSFLHNIKKEQVDEREQIQYWLKCAYEQERTSPDPFYPIAFFYTACKSENISEDQILSYMNDIVDYIYYAEGTKEAELCDGWLKKHKNQLPQEYQMAAGVYLGTVRQVFSESKDNTKKAGFKGRNWLIGFAAGILLGAVLGASGTALVLKGDSDTGKSNITQIQGKEDTKKDSSKKDSSKPEKKPGKNDSKESTAESKKEKLERAIVWTSSTRVKMRNTPEIPTDNPDGNVVAFVKGDANLEVEIVGAAGTDEAGREWTEIRLIETLLPGDSEDIEVVEDVLPEGRSCYIVSKFLKKVEE
ncbi:MAG: hypothetical protein Q4F21_08625 [Lachnospiraceae bacterium]|nr:hypothetical protein [Lachnospiraceae bacterium]